MVIFILQMGRVRKERSTGWNNLSMKHAVSETIPEIYASISDHHFFDECIYLLCSVEDIFQLPALTCSVLKEIKQF